MTITVNPSSGQNQYWSAFNIVKQVAGELGLPIPTSLFATPDIITSQLTALLNSAGNELLLYYPWEQFAVPLSFNTVANQSDYPLPDDLSYFTDQTQWDNTNHWPLAGPKSAQEWAFLKGSLVAPLPRIRYRIAGDVIKFFPTPGPSSSNITMEYISKYWCYPAGNPGAPAALVTSDGDIVEYNPWLMVKFVKFKFYELKGFTTTGVQADFMRVFNSLTGKDTGAEKLNLVMRPTDMYIGYGSIPDGNWNQ